MAGAEPFEHRAQVVAFMRSLLLEEGFRPRSPATGLARQIQFRALREGVVHELTVVRSGQRHITVLLETPDWSMTYRFAVGFDA